MTKNIVAPMTLRPPTENRIKANIKSV